MYYNLNHLIFSLSNLINSFSLLQSFEKIKRIISRNFIKFGYSSNTWNASLTATTSSLYDRGNTIFKL